MRKFTRAAAAVSVRGKGIEQPLGRHRSDQEVAGSGTHRLDCVADTLAMGENKHRKTWTDRSQRGDQARSTGIVPGPEQRSTHFAPMGTLEESDRGLLVSCANRAPPLTGGNGRDEPALIGIGINQQ